MSVARVLIVLVALAIAVTVTGVTVAQEAACSVDDLADTLTALESLVTDAREAQNEGDAVIVIPAIQAIGDIALQVIAQCRSLAWEGESEVVLGPVDIPEGFYRARVVTEGYFSASAIAISGECGSGTGMYPSAFLNLSAGDASQGAEGLVVSEGCTALIEIENVSEPSWTLELTEIG